MTNITYLLTYLLTYLRNNGFHEFMLTILPWSLFNIFLVLLYSALVSKLLISNDSFILRSCMLSNFACFWVQPIKPPMTIFGMFSCTQRFPFSFHAIFLVFEWDWAQLIQWAHALFVSPMYSSPNSHNLICKHQGNCLVIVYFCCCTVYFLVLQLM